MWAIGIADVEEALTLENRVINCNAVSTAASLIIQKVVVNIPDVGTRGSLTREIILEIARARKSIQA